MHLFDIHQHLAEGGNWYNTVQQLHSHNRRFFGGGMRLICPFMGAHCACLQLNKVLVVAVRVAWATTIAHVLLLLSNTLPLEAPELIFSM